MIRKYDSKEQALKVAKEAMWLAFQAAGGPQGMGFLQDRKGVGKEDVWNNAYNKGDYSGRIGMAASEVSGDYVFGRMLKLYFSLSGNTIKFSDNTPRRDYQAWCGLYPTYVELFNAAEQSVGEAK